MATTQDKKPKEQLHELMIEMFEMIELINIPEGEYLKFAEMFKQMNININLLQEIQKKLINNTYYQRYILTPTIRQKKLNEAQKAVHPEYTLCSCGSYIKKIEQQSHINNTLKHTIGIRNKKYSVKCENQNNPIIDFKINREVILNGFCIIHYSKLTQRRNI